MGGRSPANITHFLDGLDFPATKDELIDHAEDNNAPQEVLDVLEQLPDQEYSSMADVMSGVGQVE
jgi:predicted secreted protein